jgi:hypothetical protein
MRHSLMGLLCLFVLSGPGNSNAQQTCPHACPPSVVDWQGESSEVIQGLLLRRREPSFSKFNSSKTLGIILELPSDVTKWRSSG